MSSYEMVYCVVLSGRTTEVGSRAPFAEYSTTPEQPKLVLMLKDERLTLIVCHVPLLSRYSYNVWLVGLVTLMTFSASRPRVSYQSVSLPAVED